MAFLWATRITIDALGIALSRPSFSSEDRIMVGKVDLTKWYVIFAIKIAVIAVFFRGIVIPTLALIVFAILSNPYTTLGVVASVCSMTATSHTRKLATAIVAFVFLSLGSPDPYHVDTESVNSHIETFFGTLKQYVNYTDPKHYVRACKRGVQIKTVHPYRCLIILVLVALYMMREVRKENGSLVGTVRRTFA